MESVVVTSTASIDTTVNYGNFLVQILNVKYIAVAGAILMIIVAMLRQIIIPDITKNIEKNDRIKKYIPLIVLVTSLLGGIGTWCLNTNLDIVAVLGGSLAVGLSAIGSFQTAVKPFMRNKKKKPGSIVEEKNPQ